MPITLKPLPGFDWGRVTWGHPNARVSALCSYCSGGIASTEVPLRMWGKDGRAAQFCNACQKRWWGVDQYDDDDVSMEFVGEPADIAKLQLLTRVYEAIEAIGAWLPDSPNNRGKIKMTPCPICNAGKLKVYRSFEGGKLRIVCSTQNCLSVVE